MFRYAIVIVILLSMRAYCGGCSKEGVKEGESANVVSSEPQKRVVMGPTRLRYFEGDDELTLYLEMTPKYDIVYVPTPRRWVVKMPQWCRHRRDHVMADIKRLTADRPIKWVDDDT